MTDREDLTVDELRDELRERDLKVSGTKDELIARLDDAEDGHAGDADGPGDDRRSERSGPTLREVSEQVRDDLSEVLDLDVERVTGLARDGDGWRAQVDVVEVSRVPPSTDVLATYEVTTDGDGNLTSFERVERFRRSEGSQR